MEQGFFEHVRLQPQQRAELERQADDLLEKAILLEKIKGTATLEWKKVRNLPGLDQTYSGHCTSQIRDRYFKGMILSLLGDFREGMDVIQTTNTATYMYMMKELYENCLDAKVLSVVKKSNVQSITIKYLVLDLPGISTNPRDFCFLESTGICIQKDKTEFGYCVMESIELRECPILPASFGVTRGILTSTGMFLRPSLRNDAFFDICYSGGIDLCLSKGAKPLFGAKPRFLLLHGLTRFPALLDTRRIERKILHNRSIKWQPNAKTSLACTLCCRQFHAFRHQRICRGCVEAMCSKCCRKRTFRAMSSGDLFTVYVCVRCILESRESEFHDVRAISTSLGQEDARTIPAGWTRGELDSLAKRFMEISVKSKETLSIVRHNTSLACTGTNGIKIVTDTGEELEPDFFAS